MSDEMKFKEEELESMADKLLEQAAKLRTRARARSNARIFFMNGSSSQFILL